KKPKIALNFNLDESTDKEKYPDSEEEKIPQYKYREVVRGKDKRAKLNGYFCADCEKYFGSLKLSEAEIQERLKACSRHRARFSPPPSTPEHFWQVDFMNTNEYIEKGYMRTESELPREKRKLKSRRYKLGKQQKS
ncbi:DNA endonuclease RBBP8-like isoform X1, partial [Paramuricea clavata]